MTPIKVRVSVVDVAIEIGSGVFEVDTKLGGWDNITAGYLIRGDAPLLIEVGSQSSVDTVLDELSNIGLGAGDLAGIALTHIHLDHAGGVGDIAKAFPNATIYVHERGARHLADPSRLISSAETVYGEKLDTLYGRLLPTDASRIRVVGDGDEIRISTNHTVEVINSPGHAKHHLGYFDNVSGLVFTGDAAGVLLPEIRLLRPATPPADFDLASALSSLRRFKEYSPIALAFAHYGVYGSPEELLDEAIESLISWATVAERAYLDGDDIESALYAQFDLEAGEIAQEAIERFDTLNGIHSNAQGLKIWLERGGASQSAIGEHHGHAH